MDRSGKHPLVWFLLLAVWRWWQTAQWTWADLYFLGCIVAAILRIRWWLLFLFILHISSWHRTWLLWHLKILSYDRLRTEGISTKKICPERIGKGIRRVPEWVSERVNKRETLWVAYLVAEDGVHDESVVLGQNMMNLNDLWLWSFNLMDVCLEDVLRLEFFSGLLSPL